MVSVDRAYRFKPTPGLTLSLDFELEAKKTVAGWSKRVTLTTYVFKDTVRLRRILMACKMRILPCNDPVGSTGARASKIGKQPACKRRLPNRQSE
jgi:hypothetical protein